MAEFNQFGNARPNQSADRKVCGQYEVMLADAVDGSLSAEDQAAFDLHLLGCPACTEMLADAKRGAAWLGMLREQRPEPPATMLERIFASTSGIQTSGIQTGSVQAGALLTGGAQMQAGAASGSGVGVSAQAALGLAGGALAGLDPAVGVLDAGNVLPFRRPGIRRINFGALRHTFLQPRLAMTAAMAFFSIALTLNLTGVRLSDFQASDLKPSSLKRSLYEANAHVVRYYTNLRVVYELESRVRDLQRSSDDTLPATPAATSNSDPQKPGSQNSDPQKRDLLKKDGSLAPNAADPAGTRKGQDPDKQPRRKASPGTSRREPNPDGLRDMRVFGVLAAGKLPGEAMPVSEELRTGAVAVLVRLADSGSEERGTV